MKSIVLVSVAAASGLLVLGSGCSKHPPSPDVLARVGSREITAQDLANEVQWYGEHRRTLPSREALLEELISRELRVQKARTLGLDKDPGVLRAYENTLAAKLEERQLQPKLEQAQVTSAEVGAEYQRDLARYTRRAKVRLALVLVKTDPKMDADTVAQLQTRIAEARKQAEALPPGTRGFGAVAANFSEDQTSRYRGGDVGWFDVGLPAYRWPEEVVSAGFALKNNGDLSEVIHAADGFYIVSRLDSREPVVTPLGQVQNSIERRLQSEKREQVGLAFAQQLRSSVGVTVFADALQHAQYPTSVMASAQGSTPPAVSLSP